LNFSILLQRYLVVRKGGKIMKLRIHLIKHSSFWINVILFLVMALLYGCLSQQAATQAETNTPPDLDTLNTPLKNLTWSRVAASPLGRTEAQGVAVENKLYVFGGYTSWTPPCVTRDVQVFDPAKKSWTGLGSTPEPLTHSTVAVDGTTLYLAGGYINPACVPTLEEVVTPLVWTFDTVTAQWSNTLPPLPEARGAGALVRLGRTLHFFGGTDSERIDKGDHWALELDGKRTWEALEPLPNPRSHMGYAVLNGEIYAVGGQHCYQQCAETQQSVHVYTLKTDSWREVAKLPLPLSHISSATLVIGQQLITFGGESAHNVHIPTVFRYDPIKDTWGYLPALPEKRNSGVVGFIGGNIYLSGGSSFSRTTFKAKIETE
jgi:N-acetylneuraminic acid mutarotase